MKDFYKKLIAKLPVYLTFIGYAAAILLAVEGFIIDAIIIVVLSFLSLLPRFGTSIILEFAIFGLLVKLFESNSFAISNEMALTVYFSLIMFTIMRVIEILIRRKLVDENKLEG